jgi:hypothetical protein
VILADGGDTAAKPDILPVGRMAGAITHWRLHSAGRKA